MSPERHLYSATVKRYQTLVLFVVLTAVIAFAALYARQTAFIEDFRHDVYQSCLLRQENDQYVRDLWASLARDSESREAALAYQRAADNLKSRDCSVYK